MNERTPTEFPLAGEPATTPLKPGTAPDLTVFTAPQADRTQDIPPLRLGKYELLSLLGDGGMGKVYKARDVGMDRLVALKIIRPEKNTDPDLLARFQLEVKAVARLKHSHIVQIYEVGESEGQPYYAMEYMEGGNLSQFYQHRPQPPDQVARLGEKLARAMHYAHEQKIVHRDLKPINILLAPLATTPSHPEANGSRPDAGSTWTRSAVAPVNKPAPAEATGSLDEWIPKISDFGLVKFLDMEGGHTRTDQAIGTPPYMAPEQLPGKDRLTTPLVDVYGLGTILYALLTGQAPFHGQDASEIMHRVRTQDPAPPRDIQATIPVDLETITLKCLEKEPAKRYLSAEALADELSRFLDRKPILARPVTRIERAWRWCNRNPAVATASGSALASLVLGTSFALFFAIQAEQGKQQAEYAYRISERGRYAAVVSLAQAAYEKAEIQRTQRLLEELTPQGKRDPDLRGFEWYFLNHMCHLDLYTLQGHTGQVGAVAISPDDTLVATGDADGAIRIWNRASGELLRMMGGHRYPLRYLRFSPDGQQIVSSAGEQRLAGGEFSGEIRLWNVATGETRRLWPGSITACVDFSPDGRRLIMGGGQVNGSDGPLGKIIVRDAHDGKEIAAWQRAMPFVSSVAYSPDGNRIALSGGNSARVWDANTGKEIFVLHGHQQMVRYIRYSPDGKWIATASFDGTVKIWNAASGQEVRTLTGHTSHVWGVAFSSDSRTLATASSDRTIKIWDLATGREIMTCRGHVDTASAVAFSGDGTWIVSASADKTAKIWDCTTSREAVHLRGHQHQVSYLLFRPQKQQLATADVDGHVIFWNTSTHQPIASWRAATGRITALAFSRDGQTLATGAEDGSIRFWNPETASEIRSSLHLPSAGVTALQFGPTDTQLISGSSDGRLAAWDTESREQTQSWAAHDQSITCIALNRSGSYLATSSADKTVKVWQWPGRQCVFTGKAQRNCESVRSVAFQPDGRSIIWPDDDLIRITDIPSGHEHAALRGHMKGVQWVRSTDDGSRLVSAELDTIKIRDELTGQEMLTLGDGSFYCTSLALSFDGLQLAAPSFDHSICLWDPVTSEQKPREASQRH